MKANMAASIGRSAQNPILDHTCSEGEGWVRKYVFHAVDDDRPAGPEHNQNSVLAAFSICSENPILLTNIHRQSRLKPGRISYLIPQCRERYTLHIRDDQEVCHEVFRQFRSTAPAQL
jgi:hypothetical protein